MLRCLLVSLSLVALTTPAAAADLPLYFKTALSRFDPAIPPDLAYTMTTRRGIESSVERFDPSLPDEYQWTLMQRDNRPATTEENSRYSSYRISTAPSTRPAFKRSDIDLSSFHLVHDDALKAEYLGRFRADLEDPMLRRLELQLSVDKQSSAIERFVLQLTEPFSPVLTVKMLELRVETNLNPPTGDLPSLPRQVSSRFRGRVFLFKSIEEDVETTYSNFIKVIPSARPVGQVLN